MKRFQRNPPPPPVRPVGRTKSEIPLVETPTNSDTLDFKNPPPPRLCDGLLHFAKKASVIVTDEMTKVTDAFVSFYRQDCKSCKS